jgi:hypothetical protein
MRDRETLQLREVNAVTETVVAFSMALAVLLAVLVVFPA